MRDKSGLLNYVEKLHQLAIPMNLYRLCGRLAPWFIVLSVIFLAVGWVWGFGFAPTDKTQSDSYRIMYIHVPAAMWSMGIYATMAITAFVGLVWQMKISELAIAAMAPVGAVFTFIALVTGATWENRCGGLVGMGCTLDV